MPDTLEQIRRRHIDHAATHCECLNDLVDALAAAQHELKLAREERDLYQHMAGEGGEQT